jgi:hypothetical protein
MKGANYNRCYKGLLYCRLNLVGLRQLYAKHMLSSPLHSLCHSWYSINGRQRIISLHSFAVHFWLRQNRILRLSNILCIPAFQRFPSYFCSSFFSARQTTLAHLATGTTHSMWLIHSSLLDKQLWLTWRQPCLCPPTSLDVDICYA